MLTEARRIPDAAQAFGFQMSSEYANGGNLQVYSALLLKVVFHCRMTSSTCQPTDFLLVNHHIFFWENYYADLPEEH